MSVLKITDSEPIIGATGISFVEPRPPQYLFFIVAGKEIKIDLKTGSVTLPEGCDFDDAAKLFWQAVQANFPFRQPETAP